MNQTKKSRLIFTFSFIVAAILGIVVVPLLLRGNPAAKKEAAIKQAVQELKSQTTLPQKVDNITTLTDVTAEPNAIHYHYNLSADADTSKLTDASIKQTLKPKACQNTGIRNNLNRDIDIEYTYTALATQKTYHLTLTKGDCL